MTAVVDPADAVRRVRARVALAPPPADAPLTDAMVRAATERLDAWRALRARWLAVR